MTKTELKTAYRGYGKVFAHSLTNVDGYPKKWMMCLERVGRFLWTLPEDTSVDTRQELIDQFMLGAGMTFTQKVQNDQEM